MKNARAIRSVVLLALPLALAALGLLLYGCEKINQDPTGVTSTDGSLAKAATTAQSAMIDIQGGGDFIIVSDEVWHFDQDCGAGYFSATGGNANQQANAKKNLAQQQRCKFWNGSGDLVGGTQGPVTVTVVSQPTVEKTCWTLTDQTGGGPVQVCYDITIAGESFVLNNKFSPNGKYSFTLRNADLTSRIQNLTVTLSGSANQVDYPGHTLVDGDGTNNCLLDFSYTGNAGTNGTAQSYLQNGTMGDILNSDSFSKNDNGCPYTTIANVDQICYSLGVGSYTVTVTGTIKGVEGNASLNFSGTAQVNISAEGCQ
jgi:hypothetical protein